MEDRENENQNIGLDNDEYLEFITSQHRNATIKASAIKAHQRQVNAAAKALKENGIDYNGKPFSLAFLSNKKYDRRTALKILGAAGVLCIAGMIGVKAKPERDFVGAKKDTQDIINDLINQEKYFGEDVLLPEEINEGNKEQFENLIKGIMANSKNAEDHHLSRDQAIYAISLCWKTTNLYETYYGESFKKYISCFSTYDYVDQKGYENYMQSGKPVPNPKNDGEYGARGINYVEGIRILEENIKSLNLQEESGKSL